MLIKIQYYYICLCFHLLQFFLVQNKNIFRGSNFYSAGSLTRIPSYYQYEMFANNIANKTSSTAQVKACQLQQKSLHILFRTRYFSATKMLPHDVGTFNILRKLTFKCFRVITRVIARRGRQVWYGKVSLRKNNYAGLT